MKLSRGDRRRHQIRAATRELFDELPFDEVNVNMISARAGITRSNFYHYFESKHAVLAEFLSEALDDFNSRTTETAPRTSTESPQDFVSRRLSAARTVFERNRQVLRMCLAQRHADHEIARMLDDRLATVTADVVAATRNPFGAPESNTIELVKILTSTTTSTLAEHSTSDATLTALERMWMQTLWSDDRYVFTSPVALRC